MALRAELRAHFETVVHGSAPCVALVVVGQKEIWTGGKLYDDSVTVQVVMVATLQGEPAQKRQRQ